MMSSGTRIAGLSGANAASQIFQFFSFIIIARDLGPLAFGAYLICSVIANFVISLFDFGRAKYFTRELAFGRLNVNDFWSQAVVRLVVLSSLTVPIGILFAYLGQYIVAATCVLVTCQHAFQLMQSLAKSQLRTAKLSMAIVIDRLLFCCAVLFLSSMQVMTGEAALVASSLAQLFAVTILLSRSSLGRASLSQKVFRQSMNPRPSFHLGLFSLTNSITSLDQMILGLLTSQAQTGLYGAVFKWFAPLGILSGAVGTITANESAKKHDSVLTSMLGTKFIWFFLIFVGFSVSCVSYFGQGLVTLLLGDSYAGSKELLVYLALSASLSLLSSPLASLLQYFGKEKQTSFCLVTMGLAYLTALALTLLGGSANPALTMSQLQLALQIGILVWLALLSFWRPKRNC
jgi:O-antigen/teichoic acid export membrane protein